jgi:hypothetical protein
MRLLHALAACSLFVSTLAGTASAQTAPPGHPPQPYPPPPPRTPTEEGAREWYDASGMLGLRGSTLGVKGGDAPGRTYGLGLSLSGTSYGAVGRFGSTRSTFFGAIGGGSGGFEGGLVGSLAFGARIPVDPEHGPVARIGFEGQIVGNDLFYHSGIQFPQGQLAYQFLTRGSVLEIGVKGAPVLDGRLNVGNDASRRLGASFGFGGYATYQAGVLSLDLDVTRVLAQHGPGTPVDAITFDVCLAYVVGVCFDARILRGDVELAGPSQVNEASAAYLGLTLGVGGLSTKTKK